MCTESEAVLRSSREHSRFATPSGCENSQFSVVFAPRSGCAGSGRTPARGPGERELSVSVTVRRQTHLTPAPLVRRAAPISAHPAERVAARPRQRPTRSTRRAHNGASRRTSHRQAARQDGSLSPRDQPGRSPSTTHVAPPRAQPTTHPTHSFDAPPPYRRIPSNESPRARREGSNPKRLRKGARLTHVRNAIRWRIGSVRAGSARACGG